MEIHPALRTTSLDNAIRMAIGAAKFSGNAEPDDRDIALAAEVFRQAGGYLWLAPAEGRA
jgi:hypothetical protein